MALAKIKLVVLIPIGPTCRADFIQDTLDSILYYTTPSRKIILLDDSGKGTGENLRNYSPDVIVLKTPRILGKGPGLYLNVCRGLEFAYKNFEFDVILRMDSDALVIGDKPEADAINFFRENPQCGILGSYKIGSDGQARDFSPPRGSLKRAVNLKSLRKDPRRLLRGWLLLNRVLRRALKNGYELGEHCLGGAVFMSYEAVRRLSRHRFLSREDISWSHLEEDHLFGLFVSAVGLKNGDFATGDLPLAVKWRGLPCSPEEMLRRNKKVMHSTRFFNDLNEDQVREFFRQRRKQG